MFVVFEKKSNEKEEKIRNYLKRHNTDHQYSQLINYTRIRGWLFVYREKKIVNSNRASETITLYHK